MAKFLVVVFGLPAGAPAVRGVHSDVHRVDAEGIEEPLMQIRLVRVAGDAGRVGDDATEDRGVAG